MGLSGGGGERLTIHGGNYGGVEKGQGLRGLGIFGVMSWDVPPTPMPMPLKNWRGGFKSWLVTRTGG